MEQKLHKRSSTAFRVSAYIVCVLLTVICIMPFLIMIINMTRSTYQIQQHPLSLIPSKYFFNNIKILTEKKTFNVMVGFKNSLIISACSTALTIYFSVMTAYAVVVYDWRFKRTFFSIIVGIMMIPGTLASIGFYQFMYKLHLTNTFFPLIVPAIAAPACVFFMRQYMIPSLPLEIVQSARIDGAGEFRIFNQIALPMMTPAMATQAIFSFVGSWNNLFMPMILLTKQEKYTMPIMVSLLRGDIYKTEHGAIYLGLFLTLVPVLVIYFLLSKYIVAGVALGGVKG